MICSTQLKSTSKAIRFCALYPEFCESQLSLARHSLDNPVFMCIHILVKYSKSTFCQRCALPQFSPISSLVSILQTDLDASDPQACSFNRGSLLCSASVHISALLWKLKGEAEAITMCVCHFCHWLPYVKYLQSQPDMDFLCVSDKKINVTPSWPEAEIPPCRMLL